MSLQDKRCPSRRRPGHVRRQRCPRPREHIGNLRGTFCPHKWGRTKGHQGPADRRTQLGSRRRLRDDMCVHTNLCCRAIQRSSARSPRQGRSRRAPPRSVAPHDDHILAAAGCCPESGTSGSTPRAHNPRSFHTECSGRRPARCLPAPGSRVADRNLRTAGSPVHSLGAFEPDPLRKGE